jgi:hypothetical protein
MCRANAWCVFINSVRGYVECIESNTDRRHSIKNLSISSFMFRYYEEDVKHTKK